MSKEAPQLHQPSEALPSSTEGVFWLGGTPSTQNGWQQGVADQLLDDTNLTNAALLDPAPHIAGDEAETWRGALLGRARAADAVGVLIAKPTDLNNDPGLQDLQLLTKLNAVDPREMVLGVDPDHPYADIIKNTMLPEGSIVVDSVGGAVDEIGRRLLQQARTIREEGSLSLADTPVIQSDPVLRSMARTGVDLKEYIHREINPVDEEVLADDMFDLLVACIAPRKLLSSRADFTLPRHGLARVPPMFESSDFLYLERYQVHERRDGPKKTRLRVRQRVDNSDITVEKLYDKQDKLAAPDKTVFICSVNFDNKQISIPIDENSGETKLANMKETLELIEVLAKYTISISRLMWSNELVQTHDKVKLRFDTLNNNT